MMKQNGGAKKTNEAKRRLHAPECRSMDGQADIRTPLCRGLSRRLLWFGSRAGGRGGGRRSVRTAQEQRHGGNDYGDREHPHRCPPAQRPRDQICSWERHGSSESRHQRHVNDRWARRPGRRSKACSIGARHARLRAVFRERLGALRVVITSGGGGGGLRASFGRM